MGLDVAASVLGASGAFSALAVKAPELLKDVYGDAAKPGVQQVGRALGTVIELSGNLLLPFRLLNETARLFEQRKFEEIAKRFSKIQPDAIVEVSPELGVPIMEKLSHTGDPTLRSLFIELLGKAATTSSVYKAHPSFSSLISSLSPDEARLLSHLKSVNNHPVISVTLNLLQPNTGYNVIHDLIFLPPADISFPSNMPLYLSNLAGLGLVEVRRDGHLTATDAYDAVIAYAKRTFGLTDQMSIDNEIRTVDYKKQLLTVLPYGAAFIDACMVEN